MQAAGTSRPPCATPSSASTLYSASKKLHCVGAGSIHAWRSAGGLPGQALVGRSLAWRSSDESGTHRTRSGVRRSASDGQQAAHDGVPLGDIPKRQLAAMALSPLAALSLPLLTDPAWQQSLATYGEKLRSALGGPQAAALSRQLDEQVTFMDWTYGATGVDLSAVWDPELWIRFKEAVARNEPAIFWNKLIDRIQYREVLPQAGLVGDMRISYAKFLELLRDQRIKRLVIYGDMRTAVVEVPHPWSASVLGHPATYPFYEDNDHVRISRLRANPAAPEDVTQWFCSEMPEWDMEKYRFYVDLPGDFWERGVLQRHMAASRTAGAVWDPVSQQYVMPYRAQKKVFQVTTEVQLLDPQESWDFMSWLLHPGRLEFYEKAACVAVALRLLSITIALSTGSQLFQLFRVSWGKLRGEGKKGGKAKDPKKMSKQEKKESAWERLTSSRAREFMTKDEKTGKMRDTGVRFEDIAGMDFLVTEMQEVVRMLKGDPAYTRVGARCPKGIIFQGPPGTGKTYLARAIAGEAGVPFFSAVGSEFVEMFAGVAAARVNNLFYTARKKAPAIIFIDEIDAIGRARSTLGGDPGSMERESALLAMLVQMDGISNKTEQVLTIGATNLAQELDAALLRPGRFEVVYEVPQPGPSARMAILRYHSRNKPLEGDGNALLIKVAEATQGWSAAALANLMNEAAILTVRRNVPTISLPMVLELVEGLDWGDKAPRIPESEAKDRLALVTAAKAVAFALTPGLEPIKSVTMWSGRRGLGPSVDFITLTDKAERGLHAEETELLGYRTHHKTNAAPLGDQPLGEFLHVAGLLVPLYAPRAAEVALYGKEAASLATAQSLADCFEIAYYCVKNSQVHPRFKSMPPLLTTMWLGRDPEGRWRRDPLAIGFDEELGYHKLTLTLLKASWRRALRLVASRRTAITRVAAEMLSAEDERISGERLVEIIESTPLDPLDGEGLDARAAAVVVEEAGEQFLPLLKEVLGEVPSIILTGEQQLTAEETQQRMEARQEAEEAAEAGESSSPQASFRVQGAGSMGMVSFRGPPSASPPRPSSPPPLLLDDSTLKAVSRAIIGRLDVMDLVGRNTALEAAERVREALLHPHTRERLQAVRRWAEEADGEFPPPPVTDREAAAMGPDGPLYGRLALNLEWWSKRRRGDAISWSAMEMLMNERQRRYFAEDADMPADAYKSEARK
ncbi:hypothetical protein PLESTB_001403000 [Pleodorina starrii]|uniref:AAA+ ATPase domain-containing protein n=1 Tax=Pleodorina starrii TaxID=330485 RepID=A0A9W6BWG0_9CHLO|nr:hypothetical protein PLESTM_002099400 [Pleodorina starrii]GLC58806.1 hypothetical protein PLESTB_001403000 [Pleodorina starrii]GLC68737.1 hypothetical protein PLESTF_000729700 [Pleodorina starrii]